jgi:hypothetical protein
VASYIFGDLLEFNVAFAEFYYIFRFFFEIWRIKNPKNTHFENKIRHLTIFRPKNNHWSLLHVLTLWLLVVRCYLIKSGWASTTQPFFLLATCEREIEYQKLVNAIFLEVFNRQKWEKQIAIFDLQCVAKLKKAHERSILHI